ncbi:hypothetical protein BGX38DRAFT_1137875 [Terfezia claveryi]|nr:hypothetical protein BGX38DRAFT_1137875 [Terfezia claveryi]
MENKVLRQSFTKLCATSSLSLGLNWGVGKRSGDLQSRFRAELIESSNAKHPDHQTPVLWYPITAGYLDSSCVTAAHIFPHKHGQDIMDAIFGAQESPELFSPLNGLLISKAVEEKIDKGLILIVPDADHARDWEATSPKEYKIRVLSKDAPGMDRYISAHTHTTWAELDGRRLKFQSNHRPRARYLYFLYCSVILRRSWTVQKAGDVLKDKLGRPYWGTVGKYVKKNQILGFIEQMGHEYQDLLMGATEEGGENNSERHTIAF